MNCATFLSKLILQQKRDWSMWQCFKYLHRDRIVGYFDPRSKNCQEMLDIILNSLVVIMNFELSQF